MKILGLHQQKKLFASVIVCCLVESVLCQTPSSGSGNKEIRLSIKLQTNVVSTLGKLTVFQTIENSSTNAIAVEALPSARYFLVTNAGQTIPLSAAKSGTRTIVSNKRRPILLKPGESHESSESLVVNKQINPGDYQIKAQGRFLIISPERYDQVLQGTKPLIPSDGAPVEVVSTLVEVKIKE